MKDKAGRKEGLATRSALVGGGIGLGLFTIYGVMNASFIGGIMGLNLAGVIMGFPVESVLLSKVLVALGMLSGILVAGLLFVTAGATAGWLAGKLTDLIVGRMHHSEHISHPARH